MAPSRNRKLVVIIDDDALVLEATRGLVRSWGCQVVAAESCKDAVAKLSELGKRPDLIVCDYRLPEGSTGVDAIETLRGTSEIPALLVTGDPTLAECDDDLVGGYRLLHKPVNPKTFRAMLVDASVLSD